MIGSFFLRLIRRLMRKIDPMDLIYFLFYLLAMACLCAGLINIILYLQADRTLAGVFCCVVVGWILASSTWGGWKVNLLALGFGLGWCLLVVGRMVTPVGAVVSALVPLVGQWIIRLIDPLLKNKLVNPSLDFGTLAAAWNGLRTSLAAISERLAGWITATRTGTPLIDPLVTNLIWNAAIYLVAFWGAWFIRRKRSVIVGLLPSVALLTYLLYYTNSENGMTCLILLGGLMVLFQAAEGYRSARQRWQVSHMDRVDLEFGLAATALGLAAGLMLFGGTLPSVSIREIRQDIQRFNQARQDEHLGKSLGLKQSPSSTYSLGGPLLLPPIHIIGAGPHLPQDAVLYVTIEGYSPHPPGRPSGMSGQAIPPSFYLRGQTYDVYTGFGWTAFPASEADYPAGGSILTPQAAAVSENNRLVRQFVQRAGYQGGTLFVSGELLSADQAFQVTWRGQNDLISAQTDALAYWASSRETRAPINRLRSAGINYPASIRARYLQLPADLPERVRSLALDLTAAQATPYDQAVAIEAYLRQFPYTLDVPAPALGRDATDFFLFDLRKGYCDYYATAMTVLARAAGIPARVVIGYVSGLFDYNRGQYIVTEADAHAWVEIYFPGIGWVEFEPTPNLPVIASPGEIETNLGLLPTAPAKPGIENAIAIFFGLWFRRLAPYLLIAAAAFGVMLFLPIGRWILLIQPADQAVIAIHRSLYRQGRRWGIPTDAARTPDEYAAELLDLLSGRLRGQRESVLESIRGDLGQLTGTFNRLFYSSRRLSPLEHQEAVRIWFHLRRQLTRLWIREMFSFPRKGEPGME